MKKTFTFLAMAAFGLSAVAQISVPETNKGVYNKVTATWCPPCGSWGWDLSNDIKTAIGDDNVVFTMQASSTCNLYSPDAQTMANAIGFGGYPNFLANYVNETVVDQQTGGIYTTQTKDAVIAAIQAHESATVDVQVGFTATKDVNNITVNTTTKFFNAMNGDYYLGVYAVENGPMSTQSSQSGTVEHKNVMRVSASSLAWGEQIASGSIDAGSTYDQSFTIPIDQAWDADKMEIALVITDKVGNTYNFVNANKTPSNQPVGINGEEFVNEVKVFPNPANDRTVIRVKSTDATDMNVSIYNAIGQNVANVFNGTVVAQEDIFVNTANLESGVYFVKVTSGNKVKTVKLNVAH